MTGVLPEPKQTVWREVYNSCPLLSSTWQKGNAQLQLDEAKRPHLRRKIKESKSEKHLWRSQPKDTGSVKERDLILILQNIFIKKINVTKKTLENLKTTKEEEITKLNEEHTKEVTNLKTNGTTEVQTLQEEINTLKNEKETLTTELNSVFYKETNFKTTFSHQMRIILFI